MGNASKRIKAQFLQLHGFNLPTRTIRKLGGNVKYGYHFRSSLLLNPIGKHCQRVMKQTTTVTPS